MSEQKIEKLTKEQEAMIPVYLERFQKIVLSTEPTNREKAEAAIRRSYNYLSKIKEYNYKPNPEIVWCESPMAGAKLAAQFTKGDENVTQAEIQAQASLASFGSFEAYWVATYAFIAEQLLPEKKDELIDIEMEIAQECGIYWQFEDLVVLTPKPKVIKLKDKKLHALDGMALEYPNGDGIYAVNGKRKNSLMEVVFEAKNMNVTE